jgi:hypothetical protein
MPSARPWTNRWVTPEGGGAGKEVWLSERDISEDDDPTAAGRPGWWSFGPDGEFGVLQISRWQNVKTNDDGGQYQRSIEPSDIEKEAIMVQLAEHKAELSRRRNRPAPETEAPGREADERGVASTRAGGGSGGYRAARTPFRNQGAPRGSYNRRRPFRARLVERTREVGASTWAAGAFASFGGCFKIYSGGSVFFEKARSFLMTTESLGGRGKSVLETFEFLLKKGYTIVESCVWLGGVALTNWDSLLVGLALLYFLKRLFFAPSEGGYQAARFREGEKQRDEEEREERKRQHEELLSMQRRHHQELMGKKGDGAPGGGGGAFGLGSELEGRAGAYQDQIGADRRSAGEMDDSLLGAARRKATSVQDRVRRLLHRTRNPLERVTMLIRNLRDMPYWSLPEGFEERLAEDVVSSSYGKGVTMKQRTEAFLTSRSLTKSHAARVMLSIADVADALIIDDDCGDLLNLEGFEGLMRWHYALEKTFEECRVEADHEGSDPKKLKTRFP